jgi:hypothetical protein
MTVRVAVGPVFHVGPSWTQLVVVAMIGVVGLLIAAAIGAGLGARWTKGQTLELHRVQREQDALIRLLDLLSIIDMAVLRSIPNMDVTLSWSEAVEGVGAPMIREFPGVTWDRSEEPEAELYQWGRIAKAVLDAEEEWRDSLKQRINRHDIAAMWSEVRDTGARMGLKGTVVDGRHLPPYHAKIELLMDEIRKYT